MQTTDNYRFQQIILNISKTWNVQFLIFLSCIWQGVINRVSYCPCYWSLLGPFQLIPFLGPLPACIRAHGQIVGMPGLHHLALWACTHPMMTMMMTMVMIITTYKIQIHIYIYIHMYMYQACVPILWTIVIYMNMYIICVYTHTYTHVWIHVYI